ncbi:heavy metal sensor histidine kinase [Ottowia testudinis]|uniref:Sensor protein n=1 Tax=Ottowia testudinis TaxID=2816950 RepID=A0A975H2M4_9BURK|nr:heavy metal sensor histidine kinase [Ottowia testudinis]QTD44944.1 heavy metal sensor histidine kinase [Ottowia testudinis]
MKKRVNWSLEQRQWLGLAVLTLFGLILVSLVVYFLTASHLSTRRHASLVNMTGLVDHLLQEKTEGVFDGHSPFDRLNDHFSGHSDLSLILFLENGQPIFKTKHIIPEAKAASLDFEIHTPLAATGKLHGRISQDKEADAQLLKHLLLTLAGGSLLGVLVFAFGGLVLIRRGVRPVQHLMTQIQSLDAANLQQRLDDSRQPAELQPLVHQFNQLLQRIEKAYRQLEGFNADVAHELNTPLATLITSTEVALRKQRDAQTLVEIMGSHLEDLQRMSGMIKDMLFLAQVDRGAKARRNPVSSMKQVVSSVAEYHEAALAEAGLSIVIDGDGSGQFDVPLIKRAVSNLLGNATRYAARNSIIMVKILQQPDEMLGITTVNQGIRIAPEQLSKIFDRMYRVEASRTESETHHGLGLSIVAAVARMHDGLIFAASDENQTEIGFSVRAYTDMSQR